MKTYNFLFWAYNLIWLGIAAFIWLVFRRIRTVDRRLAGLEQRLDARDDSRR